MGGLKGAWATLAAFLRERVPPLAWFALASVAGIGAARLVAGQFALSADENMWFWGTTVALSAAVFIRHRCNRNLAVVIATSYGLLYASRSEIRDKFPTAMLFSRDKNSKFKS